MKKTILTILKVLLVLVFLFSGYKAVHEINERKYATNYIHEITDTYSPEVVKKDQETIPDDTKPEKDVTPDDTHSENDKEEEIQFTENPSVKKLVLHYPDVIGWLTCESINVDLPFVRGSDNAEYLRADLDKSYLVTGTLFLDYRNNRDMNDSVAIVYGHNMKNGTMFANLSKYRNQDFLESNPDLYISYPDYTAHYVAYASTLIDATSSPLYKPNQVNSEDAAKIIRSSFDNINSSVSIDSDSTFLILSTCSPEFFYARTAVVFVLESIY